MGTVRAANLYNKLPQHNKIALTSRWPFIQPMLTVPCVRRCCSGLRDTALKAGEGGHSSCSWGYVLVGRERKQTRDPAHEQKRFPRAWQLPGRKVEQGDVS